jgi:predicted N-acetyltransferase YhbS
MTVARRARSEDYEAVVELIEQIFTPPEAGAASMVRRFPHALSRANVENLYLIERDGRPVSAMATELETVAIGDLRLPVGTLGMVCTHEDHRGHRYAGEVLEAACDGLRQEGAVAVMISGWRTLYTATGGARVFPMFEASVTCDQLQAAADPSLDVQPVTPDTIDELVALHDAEPRRFLWTDDWQKVVLPGLLMSDIGTGYLVRRGGRTVAAASVLKPFAAGQPHGLLAWYGDREAVVAALGRMAGADRAETVRCHFLIHDTAFHATARAAGFDIRRHIPGKWTLRVLDFPRLLDHLRGYLSAALGEQASALQATGDGFRVRLGNAAYEIPDIWAATKILFAMADEVEDNLRAVPEAIRDLFARALPVPLPAFGLNYI